ncbi:trypsin-like serine protease [Bdellovibrio sp. SKB1291214]|uniref:S1 family peptidase n=1 Tax=Bdellovibrio sp. SKB1291214 TaxID=1732569 RepID=UPI00159628DB|nr:trypsin-like serine protease [Bdellovibrio sp. SKB1291214]UYL09070.1 trypsin-like serine protease [Bdellovibrio sp. SKB1291214]
MRSNLLKHLTSLSTMTPPRVSLPVFVALLALYSLPSQAIVGGQLVPPSAELAKHTVAIYAASNASTCTGTLIAPDIVVTAAHCLIRPKGDLTVIFGTDSVEALKDSSRTRKVIATAISPEFSRSEYGDLGLIKMASPAPAGYTPVPYAKSVMTPESILMATSSMTTVGLGEHVSFTFEKPFILAGYGFFKQETIKVDRNDPRLQPAIQEGRGGCNDYKTVCRIEIIGHDKKLRVTSVLMQTMNPMALILDETHGRGTCYGDSGGPAFVLDENKRFILVGVNSGGDGSGDCGHAPGIKSLVSYFAPWIEDTIRSGF